jgi:hypothetical protein
MKRRPLRGNEDHITTPSSLSGLAVDGKVGCHYRSAGCARFSDLRSRAVLATQREHHARGSQPLVQDIVGYRSDELHACRNAQVRRVCGQPIPRGPVTYYYETELRIETRHGRNRASDPRCAVKTVYSKDHDAVGH